MQHRVKKNTSLKKFVENPFTHIAFSFSYLAPLGIFILFMPRKRSMCDLCPNYKQEAYNIYLKIKYCIHQKIGTYILEFLSLYELVLLLCSRWYKFILFNNYNFHFIQDANNNKPIFQKTLYTASVPESSPPGNLLLRIFSHAVKIHRLLFHDDCLLSVWSKC